LPLALILPFTRSLKRGGVRRVEEDGSTWRAALAALAAEIRAGERSNERESRIRVRNRGKQFRGDLGPPVFLTLGTRHQGLPVVPKIERRELCFIEII
jgi:hypothetical protein